MIPCAMQARIGPLVDDLVQVDHAIAHEQVSQVLSLLRGLKAALLDMKTIFQNVSALVDPDDFYDIYRPALGAWWDDPVVLSGVQRRDGAGSADSAGSAGSAGPKSKGTQAEAKAGDTPEGGDASSGLEIRAKGPSAGQSSIFMLLDIALGVSHSNQKDGGAGAFQKDMLVYMPRKHRMLVRHFKVYLGLSSLPRPPPPRRSVLTFSFFSCSHDDAFPHATGVTRRNR